MHFLFDVHEVHFLPGDRVRGAHPFWRSSGMKVGEGSKVADSIPVLSIFSDFECLPDLQECRSCCARGKHASSPIELGWP